MARYNDKNIRAVAASSANLLKRCADTPKALAPPSTAVSCANPTFTLPPQVLSPTALETALPTPEAGPRFSFCSLTYLKHRSPISFACFASSCASPLCFLSAPRAISRRNKSPRIPRQFALTSHRYPKTGLRYALVDTMYSTGHAAMPPPAQARQVAPETFLLDHDAQQSLPPDAIVALQQVDNRTPRVSNRAA